MRGSAKIISPGCCPEKKYQPAIVPIDTGDIDQGEIVIRLALGDGESAGSFGLDRGSKRVAQSYDVPSGSTTTLQHAFKGGGKFSLYMVGNWFSRTGSVNSLKYEIVIKCQPSSLDGLWNISWQKDKNSNGLLQLHSGTNEVRGNYHEEDSGRLIMHDAGSQLSGYWIENDSDKECGSSREGSSHWGKLLLKSGGTRDRFAGTWGYCNEAGPYSLTIWRNSPSQSK